MFVGLVVSVACLAVAAVDGAAVQVGTSVAESAVSIVPFVFSGVHCSVLVMCIICATMCHA